jgi:cell division protease FtsH
MFVGVGASRVRELFAKAKKAAPCILFIDELDAVGRTRSGNTPGAPTNDERDQTINQLLTAMDGFAPNAGVIVIAATNRPDILDPALLRPGRFDRRVAVELPDLAGRAETLAVHMRTRPIAPEVSLASYARVTVGFSGADLESLCNEAAIYAARADSATITTEHLEAAFERIVLGEARSSVVLTDKKKRILAFHEAGHALMSVLVGDYDLCRKVSIVPRGRTGGATYFQPSEDRLDLALMTRSFLENKIMVAYGGRVAEELVFGTMNVTTGASGDLQEVYKVAHQMVTVYGFNEKLGRVAWTEAAGAADGGPDGEIGAEIRFIVKRLYARARELLSTQQFYLHRIAEELVQKEVLRTDDILRLTQGMVCTTRKPYSSYEEESESGGADA